MSECCGDGNFCDFPWCDCSGNVEYRQRHALIVRSDQEIDCGHPECRNCEAHRRRTALESPTAASGMPDASNNAARGAGTRLSESANSTADEGVQPTRTEHVIGLLLDVARTAFRAADDSEDDGSDFIKIDRAGFAALSAALDKLDELPDDQPGYVMEGPAKARWALRAGKSAYPLAVWFGSMPESNGKANWTAILYADMFSDGFTLERSEYKDRVRYAADRVRFLLGALEKEPFILDYDSKLIEHDDDAAFAEWEKATAALISVAAPRNREVEPRTVRMPLKEDEIQSLWMQSVTASLTDKSLRTSSWHFARAIEAHHGINSGTKGESK